MGLIDLQLSSLLKVSMIVQVEDERASVLTSVLMFKGSQKRGGGRGMGEWY